MALSFFMALLFVQGCSSNDEAGEPSEADETAVVPMAHVIFEAQALTLERMLAEGDPEEIFANTESENTEEYLRSRSMILVADGDYSVETDISAWDDEFGSTTGRPPPVHPVGLRRIHPLR